MKLQQTQPMGAGSTTGSLSTISAAPDIQSTEAEEEEWEEEYEESGLVGFSIVVLILALIVIGVQFWTYSAAG